MLPTVNAMLRSKENNPLPSQTRANGSVVLGTSRPPPSSDFFTDSILEDTSKIPSPSPRKHAANKPRRAVVGSRPLLPSRDSANAAHPSSSPQSGRSSKRHLQPAPVLKKPSPKPSQQNLITPPQSRDGKGLRSPTSDVSSPPRALTDVYQRIQDEEDLAATERESGPDSEEEMVLRQNVDLPARSGRSSSQRSLTSKQSTPVTMPVDSNKENMLDEQTGSFSDPTGMSFVRELKDPKIASILTPHYTERAQDRRKFQNISSRPILFNQGPRPSEIADGIRPAASSDRGSPSGRTGGQRPPGERMVKGVSKAHSDTAAGSRHATTRENSLKRATILPKDQEVSEDEHTSDELRAVERVLQNRKLKRLFSGAGSASSRSASNSDRGTDGTNTQESMQHEVRWQPQPQAEPTPMKNPVTATAKGMLSMWARKVSEQRDQRPTDSSQIDWAGAGADVPLPSVEDSSTPQATPPKPDAPGTMRSQRSFDMLRRLDNDFTGMSFQVSESPPVKSKRSVEDYLRDQEMERLNKKALATSRLDAIREKDPREAHRRLSRSPSAGQLRERPSGESLSFAQHQPEPVGERVPDTPIVVYRSSSNSSEDAEQSSQRLNQDRRSSHDQLQRLARAMSTTPRSSPAPPPAKEAKADQVDPDLDGEPTQDTYASSANAPELQREQPKQQTVLATPKVTGAWTDTVLPDTAKTARQTGRAQSRFVKTPQVNAGGWIDTPMVNGNRQSSAMAPMTIEEVTEDITSEVPPQTQTTSEKPAPSTGQPAFPVEAGIRSPPQATKRQLPPSVLGRVLEDDTFEFGETTMDSLGHLLDDTTKMLDDRKLVLSQEQADQVAADELGFIDHLGGKLREVALGLHDTRKGISNLERVFMRASSPLGITGQTAAQSTDSSIFPVVYSTVTFPIPLLFHPRTTVQRSSWLPFRRPTLLGYITLAIWTWYLAECFASELFSHPLQAERYVWPPSDSPEPAFPFVIPTLVLRMLGLNVDFGGVGGAFAAVFGPIFVLLRAMYRIVGMWMGWTDGFVDELGVGAGQAIKNATAAVVQAVKSAAETGLGDDWSMMNDEVM